MTAAIDSLIDALDVHANGVMPAASFDDPDRWRTSAENGTDIDDLPILRLSDRERMIPRGDDAPDMTGINFGAVPIERVVQPPPPWAERIATCEPDWFTTAPPRRDYLLRDTRTDDGVLLRGKTGMVLAAGGLGKTTVGVQFLTAVVTATPWLGCYSVTERGRALGIFGEEDGLELRRKTFHAARSGRLRITDPSMLVMLPLAGLTCAMVESDDRGNPIDAPFYVWLRDWLRADVAKHGPFKALWVDPISRFAGMNAETDNAAATRFVQAGESLIEPSGGAAVLFAHHTNKTSRANGATVDGAAARGSSAFYDGVRWAASLSAERMKCDGPETTAHLSEVVTMTIVKSNYAPKGDPVLLRRDYENGGALLPLDAVDLATVSAARRKADPSARRQVQRAEQGKAGTTTMGAAVLAVLAAHPEGLTYRGLRGAVQASMGTCGDSALAAAWASLGPAARTTPGPNRSTIHHLAGVAT